MVEMYLTAVRVELPTNTPVVLLQERQGPRTLPIYIGTAEATAIAYALQGVTTPRPMTHDLLRDVLDAVGVELEHVAITDLREATFFAELHLRDEDQSYVVSSRPSDALALAARLGSPIYADDGLVDSEGVVLQMNEDSDELGDQEDLVGQFREFIRDVRPEDFSPGGPS